MTSQLDQLGIDRDLRDDPANQEPFISDTTQTLMDIGVEDEFLDGHWSDAVHLIEKVAIQLARDAKNNKPVLVFWFENKSVYIPSEETSYSQFWKTVREIKIVDDDDPMTYDIPRPPTELEALQTETQHQRQQLDELLTVIEGLKIHNAELQTQLIKRELAPVAPVQFKVGDLVVIPFEGEAPRVGVIEKIKDAPRGIMALVHGTRQFEWTLWFNLNELTLLSKK